MIAKKYIILGLSLLTIFSSFYIDAQQQPRAIKKKSTLAQKKAHQQKIAQQRIDAAEKRLIFAQQHIPWQSRAGLIYGFDKVYGSRVNHILHHTKPAPHKPKHAMFLAKTRRELFNLIDLAWSKIRNPWRNLSGEFNIRMGKVIGTQGETRVKIIIRPGTSYIITAYPIH